MSYLNLSSDLTIYIHNEKVDSNSIKSNQLLCEYNMSLSRYSVIKYILLSGYRNNMK